jgi:hypothetical protein
MSTNTEQQGFTPPRRNRIQVADRTPTMPGASYSLETSPEFDSGLGPSLRVLSDSADPSMITEPFLPEAEIAVTRPIAIPQTPVAWPGEVLGYKLIEKVHEGRMSTVWRAVDDRQTSVAVKLVPLDLVPTTDVQTLAWLAEVSEHPGLLTLLHHGSRSSWWYQVAEWVDGETLESRRIHASRISRAAELPSWMKDVATALEALHSAGFVHGDVKPSNIMLIAGKARLIDLVGWRVGASWYRDSGLTLAFASPEAIGGAPADPRDDVYSLAATIFLLLTGELVNPKRATDRSAAAPAGLALAQWRTLQDALAQDRTLRPRSAVALVDAMWPAAEPQGAVPLQSAPAAAAAIAPPPVRRSHLRRLSVTQRWGFAAAVGAMAMMGGMEMRQEDGHLVAVPSASAATTPAAIELNEALVAPLPAPTVARATSPDIRRAVVTSLVPDRSQGLPNAMPVVEPSGIPAEEVASVQPQEPVPVAAASVVLVASSATDGVATERLRPAMAMPVRFNPPDRPSRLIVPAGPDRPDVSPPPSRPDVPVVPSTPDIPLVPTRPDVPPVPVLPQIPVLPVLPVLPDIPVVPIRPDIPLVTGRPDRPDRPDRPNRPDKPDKPFRPDRPDRPIKP